MRVRSQEAAAGGRPAYLRAPCANEPHCDAHARGRFRELERARVSPLLSGSEGGEPPAEGIAEAVFEDGKIRSLTLASAQAAPSA